MKDSWKHPEQESGCTWQANVSARWRYWWPSWEGFRWRKGGNEANNQLVLVKGSCFGLFSCSCSLPWVVHSWAKFWSCVKTFSWLRHQIWHCASMSQLLLLNHNKDWLNLVFWPEAWPGWFSFSSMSNLKNRLFTCLSNILWYLKNCEKIRTTVTDFQILSWQTMGTWEDDKPFALPPGICDFYYFSTDWYSL